MSYMNTKQSYTLKNWVEGISDEAYYPWALGVTKKNRLELVSPTFVTEQNNVLICR